MPSKELPAQAKVKRADRTKAKKDKTSAEQDLVTLLNDFLDDNGLDIGDEIEIETDSDMIADIRKACSADPDRLGRVLRITTTADSIVVKYIGGAQ
jgi:hypothetical protein